MSSSCVCFNASSLSASSMSSSLNVRCCLYVVIVECVVVFECREWLIECVCWCNLLGFKITTVLSAIVCSTWGFAQLLHWIHSPGHGFLTRAHVSVRSNFSLWNCPKSVSEQFALFSRFSGMSFLLHDHVFSYFSHNLILVAFFFAIF